MREILPEVSQSLDVEQMLPQVSSGHDKISRRTQASPLASCAMSVTPPCPCDITMNPHHCLPPSLFFQHSPSTLSPLHSCQILCSHTLCFSFRACLWHKAPVPFNQISRTSAHYYVAIIIILKSCLQLSMP